MKPKNFKEFWPFYVNEHKDPRNRRLHVFGTTVGLISLATAVFFRQPQWILFALVFGYGCAWVGHFVLEKNRPATFSYPFYSFMGDAKLWFLTVRGKMDAEIARLNSRPHQP